MQQNKREELADKIYCELDMIRILTSFSSEIIKNDINVINLADFVLIFNDIEKRSWEISELTEKLENIKCPRKFSFNVNCTKI